MSKVTKINGVPVVDTKVTGFTYDNINTFTISQDDGSSFNTTISGLSVNTLTATTFYAGDIFGGKFYDSELTSIVRKSSPGTLSANTAVYLKGYDAINDVYTVEYADTDNIAAMPAVGILDDNITDTTYGSLTIFGVHTGIDTSSWSEGDALYVGKTPGEITNVRPSGVTAVQVFGLVITQSVNGRIFKSVNPTNNLPNIQNQKFWLGNSSGFAVETTVNDLVEETTPVTGDYFFIWDSSTSTHKKLDVNNLPGGFTSFNISGDTGLQTITDGETISLFGGEAIKTTVTPTDTVTFDLNITGTTSLGTPTTGDKLVVWDATDNTHKNIDWNQLPGAGGGEANTASNIGGGNGIFAQKVGVDLQFRSLVAGSNINISSGATTLTISSTGGGGGSSRVTGSTQTTGSTPTELDKIDILKDNATNLIEVYVKAYSTGGSQWGVWKRTLTVTKTSGTVTIREENADVDKTSSGLNANSVSFTVNSGDIDIDVTGINATTINWESAYETIL